MTDRLDMIIDILRKTSHEPKCDAQRWYHNYGCSFDGEVVGEETNIFPGNLKCSCIPSQGSCICEHRTERQAEEIEKYIKIVITHRSTSNE